MPLALIIGYIYDVTPTSSARGSLEGDRVAAMTPKQVIESASVENLQPRRSVIVTNNNHPANRSPQPAATVSEKLFELSHSSHNGICSNSSSSSVGALSSKDGYSSAGNASYNDSMVTYSMLSSLPSERASSSFPHDSQRHHSALPYGSSPSSSSSSSSSSYSAHIGDKAPVALVLSPPPAHTPTPSPIPAAHFTAPSPAHTPAPAHAPNPAHTPVPAHSHHSHAPAPAHSNTPRPAHSRAEVLPADHPIHHPLIQQLINQRLHVPSETIQSKNNNNNNSNSSSSSSNSSSSSSSPQDLLDSEALLYRRDSDSPHKAEDALREEHHMDVDFKDPRYSPVEQHHYEQHLSYYHTMAEESRVDYLIETSSPDTLNQHQPHHHYAPSFPLSSNTSSLTPYSPSSPSSGAHFPPSPSPSLPSTSPKLPTGISSSSTLSSSSLPAPPSPPSSTRTAPSPVPTSPSALSPSSPSDSEVNTYTYEAFLISDGRSRKRALEGEEKSTGRVRYTCNECGKDYATSSNLSRHKQTHRSLDSKNAKKCPHCDKVYVSMPALSMHILTHDLKHACNVCGKTFSRPWLLQGHMRSHTGEKPFGCAHCGKAFADRSNLRAHMQTHSAFKHFACKKCNKTFALKSYLNKHLESACLKDPMESSNF